MKDSVHGRPGQVRDLLKMDWNVEFMPEDMVDGNPMVWLIPAQGRDGTAAWLSSSALDGGDGVGQIGLRGAARFPVFS
jgi:hypothetical protein